MRDDRTDIFDSRDGVAGLALLADGERAGTPKDDDIEQAVGT